VDFTNLHPNTIPGLLDRRRLLTLKLLITTTLAVVLTALASIRAAASPLRG